MDDKTNDSSVDPSVLAAELKNIQREMDAYIDSYIKRINDHI